MKEYVLDANAVLRYFGVTSGNGVEKMRGVFAQAKAGRARLLMSVVNLGEVFYVLLKRVGEPQARHYIQVLQQSALTVEADLTQALRAAEIKHAYKIGYADSYAAALTLELNATLVSADPEFEKLGRSLKWVRLPQYKK